MALFANDRELAACWSSVTDLELMFNALRSQHGLFDASRAFAEMVEANNRVWLTAHLVLAVAALDSVRRELL